MIERYRTSLKMPEAEEVFDLLFFRPVAYILVLGLSYTGMTPNQVTILSLIAGWIAAWYFSLGLQSAMIIAALWYILANILDCADGQLARIKQNGTPLGRVVDGVADYLSSIAIFLGIGFGLAATGNSNWLLLIAAGISAALHAITFDGIQGQFISVSKGEEDSLTRDIVRYKSQREQLRSFGSNILRRRVLDMYLSYLGIQQRLRIRGDESGTREQFLSRHTGMMRMWTFLGPTTNRTVLIVSALLGNMSIYLWTVTLAGNFWLIVCVILQMKRR